MRAPRGLAGTCVLLLLGAALVRFAATGDAPPGPSAEKPATTEDGGATPAADAPESTEAVARAAFVEREEPAIPITFVDVGSAASAPATLAGRVVSAEGVPVPGARVRWDAAGEGGAEEREEIAADAEGRFEIAVRQSEPGSASLTVSEPDGLGAAYVEPTPPFEGRRDLGDLALAPLRDVTLTVRWSTGATAAGAYAWTDDRRFGPTGEDGVLKLRVPREDLHVDVASRASAQTTVAASASETVLEATLLRAGELSVRVVGPHGPPAQGKLSVRCRGRLFVGSTYRLADFGGAPFPRRAQVGEDVIATYELDATGAVRLFGLRDGAECELTALDRCGSPLTGERVTVDATTPREVVLNVATTGATARLVVTDREGRPVPRARAWIQNVGAADAGTTTSFSVDADAEGRLVLASVAAARIDLRVVAAGFAPFDDPAWEVPAPGVLGRVVLAPARRLVAKVVGPDGSPSPGRYVKALPVDHPKDRVPIGAGWIGVTDDRGEFVVNNLPLGASVDVAVLFDRESVSVRAGPADAVVVLAVPHVGFLEVAFGAGATALGAVRIGLRREGVDLPGDDVWDRPEPGERISFGPVPAGTYEVSLLRLDGPGGAPRAVGAPVRVEVPPDGTGTALVSP